MKINVNYLRIALLVINLVCAVSLPAYAFYRYKASTEITSVSIVEPAVFEYHQGEEGTVTGKSPQRIMEAAEALVQKPTPPEGEAIDVSKIKPPTAESSEAPGGELEPGPLANDWEYYAGFIFPDNMLLSRVILRRKDGSAGGLPQPGGGGSTKGTNRPRTNPIRPQRVTLGGKKAGGMPQQQGDKISFSVRHREYKNEDLGLNFRIHAVDAEQFVYSLPSEFKEGHPPKKYALKRVRESHYAVNPKEGLAPIESAEAATPEGGEGEAKPPARSS